MTVEIYERHGREMKRIGEWSEEDGWIEGSERLSFRDDDQYTEEMMVEHFDGPYLFGYSTDLEKGYAAQQSRLADFNAVTVEEDEEDEPSDEEKSHDEGSGEKVIVDSPADAPNDKVVHVEVDDEGEPTETYYYR
jgi:hypothetical protein